MEEELGGTFVVSVDELGLNGLWSTIKDVSLLLCHHNSCSPVCHHCSCRACLVSGTCACSQFKDSAYATSCHMCAFSLSKYFICIAFDRCTAGGVQDAAAVSDPAKQGWQASGRAQAPPCVSNLVSLSRAQPAVASSVLLRNNPGQTSLQTQQEPIPLRISHRPFSPCLDIGLRAASANRQTLDQAYPPQQQIADMHAQGVATIRHCLVLQVCAVF